MKQPGSLHIKNKDKHLMSSLNWHMSSYPERDIIEKWLPCEYREVRISTVRMSP